jgi:hypothetical protein
VTPSAWSSSFKALQVGKGVVSTNADTAVYLGVNWVNESGGDKYITTGHASVYSQVNGVHAWYTAGSSTAGNAISFTQAMTLTSNGNLGIGTTNPTNFGAGYVSAQVTGTSGAGIFRATSTSVDIRFQADELIPAGLINVASNHPLLFNTNAIERARITSTGTFQLKNNYQEGVLTANTGTAYTIDLANGTLQILTLTGNCTFTFPTATAGQSFTMLLRQDGTGGRTVTWPAAVRWPGNTAPTITSTASQTDKYIFTADGTRWYGSNAGQAYVA